MTTKFWLEIMQGKDNTKDLSTDRIITSKWILGK
jgi:hypothetical protein